MKGVEAVFTVEFWGPYACFTPPYAKVERLSLAVPTPSALRNMMQSIYGKPQEFYWLIRRIEVMNPIKYQACKRNEVNRRFSVSSGSMDSSDPKIRTQRHMTMLRDVRYRVTAELMPRDASPGNTGGLCAQARRRLERGQCFKQPYFGIRECVAYFKPADTRDEPIHVTQDFGLVTYDTHDPTACNPGDSTMQLSLYHCTMVDGVIEVPDWDSPEVIKLGGMPDAAGVI